MKKALNGIQRGIKGAKTMHLIAAKKVQKVRQVRYTYCNDTINTKKRNLENSESPWEAKELTAQKK